MSGAYVRPLLHRSRDGGEWPSKRFIDSRSAKEMRFYADPGSYLRDGWRAPMSATRVVCSGTERYRVDAPYRDAGSCALAGADGAMSSRSCGAVRQRVGFDAS